MERRQASSFRPLHFLLVFVCLSPVTSTVPQVEARPSPVDPLLDDFTALLHRAQRLEQAGVPVFQRLQQQLNAFVSGVEDAQRSLWESIARDDARGLEAAVRRGAVFERRTADKMTPLAVASKEGRADAVWALLRLGAAVDLTAGALDWTPLLWARAYRRTDCETLLLAAGANQSKVVDPLKVFFEAVRKDNAVGVETTVQLGADLEAKNNEQMIALRLAAKEGRVRAMVEPTAGERGCSSLLWAMANRQNQTEALLRKAGVQPRKVTRAEAQDLLWRGVKEADIVKIVTAVVSCADLEEKRDGWTPLTKALYDGNLGAVRVLLSLGAGLEGRGSWMQGTALHWASYKGHEAVVRQLLAAGASVEAEDWHRETPLHWSSSGGHLTIARLLVEAGADLDHRTTSGQTPLALAESYGHSAVALYLRSVGATV